jgi:hypothetical protein
LRTSRLLSGRADRHNSGFFIKQKRSFKILIDESKKTSGLEENSWNQQTSSMQMGMCTKGIPTSALSLDEPYCGRKGSLLPNYEWNGTMYVKLGKETHDVPTRLRDMS